MRRGEGCLGATSAPSQQRRVLALTCRALRRLDRAVPGAGVGHRLLGEHRCQELEPRQAGWPVLLQTQAPWPCRHPTYLDPFRASVQGVAPAAPAPSHAAQAAAAVPTCPQDRTRSAAACPALPHCPPPRPPTHLQKASSAPRSLRGVQRAPRSCLPGVDLVQHLLGDLQAKYSCPEPWTGSRACVEQRPDTHTHMHTRTCTYIHVHTHTQTRMHAHTETCMHRDAHAHTDTCMRTHTCTCTHRDTRMCAHRLGGSAPAPPPWLSPRS